MGADVVVLLGVIGVIALLTFGQALREVDRPIMSPFEDTEGNRIRDAQIKNLKAALERVTKERDDVITQLDRRTAEVLELRREISLRSTSGPYR